MSELPANRSGERREFDLVPPEALADAVMEAAAGPVPRSCL